MWYWNITIIRTWLFMFYTSLDAALKIIYHIKYIVSKSLEVGKVNYKKFAEKIKKYDFRK